MTETWPTDGPTAFKHMGVHRQACTQTNTHTVMHDIVKMHTHMLIYTHAYKQKGEIHDYWQLSSLIKVFLSTSEGVLIREMRHGQIWDKASITAFISPLQQRKEEEEQKRDKRPKSYFFCLITATNTPRREIALGDNYGVCSVINGCISDRCMQAG